MDAEFVILSNHTKNCMKKPELVEKCQFFQRVLKRGDFGQSSKGGPFAKFSKSAFFLAELRKAEKIGNTCPIIA